jgi:hypothetical protein
MPRSLLHRASYTERPRLAAIVVGTGCLIAVVDPEKAVVPGIVFGVLA